MKKIFDSQRKFHEYKTQYDYYRTSNVMYKYFSNEPFDIHDTINYRSMYVVPMLKPFRP